MWFHKLPKDSLFKTVLVALMVSLLCGFFVSISTVLLRPLKVANEEKEQKQRLLEIIQKQPGIQGIFEAAGAQFVEVQIINLATGRRIQVADPGNYDQLKASRDPTQSLELPVEHDIAKIKRRAKYAPVYLVRKGDTIKYVIVPIYGKGYASTIYGYLGIGLETRTVIGLNFYEHGETPGLGAKISDPEWLAQWSGKKIYDDEGKLRLGVAQGKVISNSGAEIYKVDALSGATWTSRSVHNMVHFWLGDYGFGPYLQNLGISEQSYNLN